MKKPQNNSEQFSEHIDYMKTALSLARRGLGSVWPNPAVGCIIVNNGRIVGRGWTQPGGRPHAETMAIKQAGNKAAGGIAYLNLEPCCHKGQTPPCTEALIVAGISEVYASLTDPDPRVAGAGFDRLTKENISINVGLLSEPAREINQGFFMRIEQGRPLITLKTATTLDGKIATKDGESYWITGEEARAQGHLLRTKHDAVMVGSGTAIADDPNLTGRLPGVSNKGKPRIVLDGRLRLPLGSKLVTTAHDTPVWLVTSEIHPVKKLQPYKDKNVDIIIIPYQKSRKDDIDMVLKQLGSRGLNSLLVEGGGHLAQSLFAADLIDQLAWFRAPTVMGGDGLSAIGNLDLGQLSDLPNFVHHSSKNLGPDCLNLLTRNR